MLQEFVSFRFYYHYYLFFTREKKPRGTFRAFLDAAAIRGDFRVGGGEKKSYKFHPLRVGGKKAAFSLREKKSNNNNNNNNIKMKIATVFPPSSVHYPHFKYFRSAKGGTSRRYGSFGSRSRTHTQTHPQQKALFNLPRDGGLLHKTGEDGQRPDRALRGPSERPAEATDSSDIITRVTPHARLFAAHTIVKPMYK